MFFLIGELQALTGNLYWLVFFLKAIAPYDPKHNCTAVYIADANEIYTGTVSDFAGNDPLIYRKRLSDDEGLRTQRDDLKVLDCK